MSLYHLTLAVRGRRALAADEADRRLRVRRSVALLGPHLLLLCLVDDHLHALLRAVRARYLARDLARSLRRGRPDLVLKAPSLDPVESRPHLTTLVRYVLQQPSRHGLPGSPALWSGSCFVDLVGARLLPGFEASHLLDELPRLRLRDLFEHVGLEPRPLAPPTDEALRAAGAARIADLSASVFAADPELRGRPAPVVAARALAARTGLRLGLPTGELARYLGVHDWHVRRLARRDLPERAEVALQRRWALEERVRAGGSH